MKKYITIFFIAIGITIAFSSCENASTEQASNNESKDSCCDNKEKTKSCDMKKTETLQAEITCPKCGNKKNETMPTDACVVRYTCEKCKAELFPKEGDCCVFCTYGSVKCPSKQ